MSRKTLSLLLFVTLNTQLISSSQAAPPTFIPPKFKEIILSAPMPEYPGGTRYIPGNNGIYRMKINPQAGTVAEVGVMKRSNQGLLDAAVVMELFKWKFKPGTLKQLDLPIEFDRGYMRPELKNAAAH